VEVCFRSALPAHQPPGNTAIFHEQACHLAVSLCHGPMRVIERSPRLRYPSTETRLACTYVSVTLNSPDSPLENPQWAKPALLTRGGLGCCDWGFMEIQKLHHDGVSVSEIARQLNWTGRRFGSTFGKHHASHERKPKKWRG